MNLDYLLERPDIRPVKDKFLYWNDFLYKKVEFNLNESLIHSREHCSRVLLFVLILGEKYKLNNREIDILAMAAVFHDTKRENDYLDTGHGDRAASYYATYCANSGLPYEKLTYLILSFHDRDDELGISKIKQQFPGSQQALLLFNIFKDSDGLDRLRLGSDWLDLNLLRTEQSHNLLSLAQELNGIY